MNYIEWVAHVGDVFARTENRYQQSSLAALSFELGLIPLGVSLDKRAHQLSGTPSKISVASV